jgi:hypothetical protein
MFKRCVFALALVLASFDITLSMSNSEFVVDHTLVGIEL